jgi:hypothetical protein
MPLGTSLPYGLRDVKITPIDDAGTEGDPVDLPNSQTFSFEEDEDFTDLRGDDRTVATRGQGASVAWELEAGGISLTAYAAMNGGTITTSGTTPATVNTYTKLATDSKPRFKVEGQAISESGGDFHIVLPNCKATDGIQGELGDGAFWVTQASGTAIADPVSNKIYDFVQNETAADIDDGS